MPMKTMWFLDKDAALTQAGLYTAYPYHDLHLGLHQRLL